MTLTQLKYVVAVDTHRHFATAADKSYITQPTLSMQIQKLEEELGVILFDRSKTPVVPTEMGERVIRQARIVLREAKELQDIASFSEHELRGTFRVGIIPTIAPYLVPLFLRTFLSKHPLVELVFEELLTSEVFEKLSADELDAAVVATPVDQSFIYSEDLYVEPFLGYLSNTHPLREKEKLTVEDLDRTNIWLLNEGHCFRDQAIKLCNEVHKKNKAAIEFKSGNLETLKKLVEQNFGMTLLPWTAVQEFNSSCSSAVVKEFENPAPSRKVRLVYSRKHLKQNMIREFKECISDSLPDVLRQSDQRILLE